MKYLEKSHWWIIFALILVIGYFHWDWIKCVLASDKAPAWAQVVAPLIAVLVAIWIATSDARYREKVKAEANQRDRDVFIGQNKALIKSDLTRLNTVVQNLKDFANPKENHDLEYRRFFVNIGNMYFLRFVDVAGSYEVHSDLPNEIIEAKILLMSIYRGLEKPEAREERIMDEEFSKKAVKSKDAMENDYLDYKDTCCRRLSKDGVGLLNNIENLKSSFEKINVRLS